MYSLNGVILGAVDEEGDLGIIVQSNLKVSAQRVKVVKTANKILGMIKQAFTCRSREIIVNLHKSLCGLTLNIVRNPGGPYLKKDTDLSEGV